MIERGYTFNSTKIVYSIIPFVPPKSKSKSYTIALKQGNLSWNVQEQLMLSCLNTQLG